MMQLGISSTKTTEGQWKVAETSKNKTDAPSFFF
jgi:hypothetical protein